MSQANTLYWECLSCEFTTPSHPATKKKQMGKCPKCSADAWRKQDKIYKELCDIISRDTTRTPEQVLWFFVCENIINSWEALDYVTKYKKEHRGQDEQTN